MYRLPIDENYELLISSLFYSMNNADIQIILLYDSADYCVE